MYKLVSADEPKNAKLIIHNECTVVQETTEAEAIVWKAVSKL